MNKPRIVVSALMVLILLTACATFQQREKQLTAEYPEWSPEVINKVSQGLVEVGMTKEQVRQALVMPQRYFAHVEGDKWSWVNETDYTREGRQDWGQVALFKDGRVVELKRFMAIPNSLVYVEWQ